MKFSVKIILFVAALSVLVSAKVAPVESALRSVTSKENCNVANVKIFENVVEVKRSESTIVRAINISPGCIRLFVCSLSSPKINNELKQIYYLKSAQSEILKMAGIFCVWYAFNAAYNVFNQYVKQDLQYPITNAAIQLLVGMLYAVPLWVLKIRKLPNLTKDDFLTLLPVGENVLTISKYLMRYALIAWQ